MKKTSVFVIVFALFLGISMFASAYEDTQNDITLKCDQNGDFTVLVVADPQCDTLSQWSEAKDELETLVTKSDPDLVIINGDMNSDNVIPSDMWEYFISPLTKRNIYWATTNGNHDPYKYEYYKMYKSHPLCLNSKVSISDKNYDASRPMNYVLPIYSNDGENIVFAIYGMDSGTQNKYGYEGLTKKQINWYQAESDALKELNGGKAVTSILCMHIPFTETVDMFYTQKDSVYGVMNEKADAINNYLCEDGSLVPKVCFHTTARQNNRGMFKKILENGDIKAAIFGHVHCTNIIGSYKGVLLGFAGKLSTGCYSDTLCRGGRVIKINQQNPQDFTVSWLCSIETSKDQPEIYSDGTVAEVKTKE